LVDDEPSVLFALKLLLEALGFAVTDFARPEDCILHLQTPSPGDVCICDLRMPGLNGFQVLSESKRLRPEVKFVLMSAHATEEELKRARSLGVDGILTKPFTPDELQLLLAQI
jgi:CheY-like chemotaxis protein